MHGQRFDFHDVQTLGAAAQGKPGQRTFYVFAGDSHSWARFWLEKEELVMLATAIDEVSESFPEEAGTDQGSAEQLVEPTEPPSLEFKVTRLALAYDESNGRIGLLVFETSEDEEDEVPPTVTCWASREQVRRLTQRIQEVVAAGRPRCRLCGGP